MKNMLNIIIKLIKKSFLFSFVLLLSVGIDGFVLAQTDNRIIGGQLFSTGAPVQVEVAPSGVAFYTSELWLFEPGPPRFLATNRDVGQVIDLGVFDPGVELVFGIVVRDTGWTFKMGPGDRNPDGIPHAAVEWLEPGVAVVGFEDLYGGGDRDYDDVVFIFRGGIASEQCGNGRDDDQDGLVDCDDSDCRGTPECGGENCENNQDDDGDGLVDCVDSDCFTGCVGIGRCSNWPRITQITPSSGGNSGTVTIAITCCNIQQGATALLRGPGGDIPAQQANVQTTSGFTFLSASFDLTGKEPGVYDVYVFNPDDTYTLLPGSFTIKEGHTGEVWIDILSRDVMRLGRTQRILIAYGNSGNTDVEAPVIRISTGQNLPIRLHPNGLASNVLHLLAGGGGGGVSTLRAGATVTVPIFIDTPNAPGNVDINMELLNQGNAPILWEELSPLPGYTQEQWEDIITSARSVLGDRWSDLMQFVQDNVNYSTVEPVHLDELLYYMVILIGGGSLESSSIQSLDIKNLKTINRDWTKPSISSETSDVQDVEVIPVGDLVVNPTRVYVITHGLGGRNDTDPNDRFRKLAEKIKELDPTANVFLVDWTPLATDHRFGPFIIPFANNPWSVKNNINFAATLASIQLASYQLDGYFDLSKTTMIGESFGNSVNEQIAKEFHGQADLALIFNPASADSGRTPPNFQEEANLSISFRTFSIFDATPVWKLADYDLLLETKEDQNDEQEHTWGIQWLTEQLNRYGRDTKWLFDPNGLGLQSVDNHPFDGVATLDGSVTPPEPLLRNSTFFPVNPFLILEKKHRRVQVVGAMDPNDKVTSSVLGIREPLRYTIFFENIESATAPAQEVIITDQLDLQNMDISTFALGPIAFGRYIIIPPPGSSSFTTVVDLRPDKNLLVKIEAEVNMTTGLATWRFSSLDPQTGQLPDDPLAGFLPPNRIPPEGDGSVSFVVFPKESEDIESVCNQATIVFDVNEPINTPSVCTNRGDLPDLVVDIIGAPRFLKKLSIKRGSSFFIGDITQNIGEAVAESSRTKFFLSLDSTIDPAGDVLIGSRVIPKLNPGARSIRINKLKVPLNIPRGRYYLGACADGDGVIVEMNEDNNCKVLTNTISIR